MSAKDDIKNLTRTKKTTTAAQAMTSDYNSEEKNVDTKEERKIERKRVSFDLRTDLHKQLKMESVARDKNIYVLIEEALDQYLNH